MQKTIKYNLDESYAQGYNDAREEIAKKLENKCSITITGEFYLCEHCKNSIAIARGIDS